jgi:4-hydroxy-tetrahydrodipicolinate synthase
MNSTTNGSTARPAFGRLLTAMVTPFDAAGEVDYKQAQRIARALIETGTEGLVVSGTTGESPTLSHSEKMDLFRAVKEAAGPDAAVLAGTSTYDTKDSIDLSRDAEKIGVDGLLLTAPYYNRPNQEGLYRHFEAIAAAVNIPAVLYNIPSRTGINVQPETIVRLSHIPNIVGDKEASGSLDAVSTIVENSEPGFLVWSGDDGFTLPLLALGGYGVVSVCAHIVGRQMKHMIESFVAGDVVEAAATHRRLLPLINAIMAASSANPVPVKHVMNQLGLNAGGVRLPLYDLDEEASAKVMAEVRKHKMDLPVGV